MIVASIAAYTPFPVRAPSSILYLPTLQLTEEVCVPFCNHTTQSLPIKQIPGLHEPQHWGGITSRPFSNWDLHYRRCPVIHCPLCLPIRTKNEPKAKRLTHVSFPQGLGPYNVSKTALLGLGKNLAIELAQSNIRVNCVAPGIIKTNFSQVVRRGCPASCWESWCRVLLPSPAFLSPPLHASHLA